MWVTIEGTHGAYPCIDDGPDTMCSPAHIWGSKDAITVISCWIVLREFKELVARALEAPTMDGMARRCLAVAGRFLESTSSYWSFTAVAMPALVTTSLWVPELLPVQPIITVWSWIYSLYFLGGLDSTGAYVSMLWDVFTNMGSFFAVLLVVILGLGHSFSLATQNESVIKQLQQVYRMGIMGDFEIDDYEVDGKDLEQHALLYIFFVLITLAITVTMLNLLIAVISDVYERVSAVMTSTKNRARAGRIAELERIWQTPPGQQVPLDVSSTGP